MKNFVHIGGHDGNDHVFECVEAYGWTGVVAEPVKWLYDELVSRYARYDVICENVAVSDMAGTADFYTIDPAKYAGLPKPWPDYSSTLDPATYEWQINNPGGYMHEDKCMTIQVSVLTLQDIIDKHTITALDLLSIDAEGCDGRIVKSVKNCTVQPTIIIFEHMHMKGDEYDDVMRSAKEMGYSRSNVFVRDTMLVNSHVNEGFLKKLSTHLDGWWWTTPASGYDPTYFSIRKSR